MDHDGSFAEAQAQAQPPAPKHNFGGLMQNINHKNSLNNRQTPQPQQSADNPFRGANNKQPPQPQESIQEYQSFEGIEIDFDGVDWEKNSKFWEDARKQGLLS